MLRRQRGGEGAAPSPEEQQLLAEAQRCLQEAAILLPPKVGPMGGMHSRGGVWGGAPLAAPCQPPLLFVSWQAEQPGTLVPSVQVLMQPQVAHSLHQHLVAQREAEAAEAAAVEAAAAGQAAAAAVKGSGVKRSQLQDMDLRRQHQLLLLRHHRLNRLEV